MGDLFLSKDEIGVFYSPSQLGHDFDTEIQIYLACSFHLNCIFHLSKKNQYEIQKFWTAVSEYPCECCLIA